MSCQDFDVDVGYGKLVCKVWGENVPSTSKYLAVHGWMDNAGSFDPLMKHFLTEGWLYFLFLLCTGNGTRFQGLGAA